MLRGQDMRNALRFRPSLWFNSMKLRNKLLFFYLFIIFIPVAAIGIVSTSRITNATMKQNLNEITASVDTINENLRNNIKLVEDISDFIYVNSTVNMELAKNYTNPAESIAAYVDVFYPLIRDTKDMHSRFVRDITIYTGNKTAITNGSELIYASDDIRRQEWYGQAIELNGKRLWSDSVYNSDIALKKAYIISLCRSLNYFSKPGTAGVLKIDVDEEYFHDLITGGDSSKRLYIVNPNGNIVSSTDRNATGKPANHASWLKPALVKDKGWYETGNEGVGYIVVYNTCSTDIESRDKWKVISAIPVKSMYSSVYEARYSGILLCMICLLVLTVLIILFSGGITRRIGKLVDKTQRVSMGDFNETVDITGSDEVADLGASINDMAANLKRLIDEVYESKIHMQEYEIKKKEAELNALQNQINPHFLYNTLDAIRMHAVISDNNELADMLVSLSSLLRYSINRGKEIVTINEEIKYVQNYMSILNMRYNGSIALNMDIPEVMTGYRILKLVIQPLVENAFVHGLKMKRGSKVITVTGSLGTDTINIDVADNGVGIPEEELEAINRELEQVSRKEEFNSSIGLNNVNSRIKLYFGMEYGIKVHSIQGEGTRVSMVLPVKEVV